MELCDWEECSVESAGFLVDHASAHLASRRIHNGEKLKSLRHVAGFSWDKKMVGAVGSKQLSATLQRAALIHAQKRSRGH